MHASITLDGVFRGCDDCGVVVINPRGQLTCLNPVAAEILSLQPILPAPMDVLPPTVRDYVRQSLRDSGRPHPIEVQLRSNGNSDHLVSLTATPLAFDENQEGLMLMVREVQPQVSLDAKIRHFEKLARLGMLSAGLAHELRNSMVALGTMADLLLEEQRDNELAQTVRRELNRANALAVQMLSYARPNSLMRKPVSTHEILDRALQLANFRFKASGTTVTKSLQADPDLISADESHLEQMFLNLLINAAEAVESTGEVNLTTDIVEEKPVGRAVRIAVQDSGVGIAAEVLPSLFQPFFTTKRHGTGLGLYLAQRIIDDHSGCINVNSIPGQGTCVQVCLPVHPA